MSSASGVDGGNVQKSPCTEDEGKFSIETVTNAFEACVDEVYMDNYLVAYKELYRFFQLMGSVFGFVASDVIEKITILENLRKSENGDNYATIESMMKYEIENDLFKKKDFVNGSRTLLRLHRALEFIHSFMYKLARTEKSGSTSNLAQDSYKTTLAQFHPWLLQKAAVVAMYTLPTKGNFVAKVCSNNLDEKTVDDVMKKMADASIHVYNMTQKLYEHYELLELP